MKLTWGIPAVPTEEGSYFHRTEKGFFHEHFSVVPVKEAFGKLQVYNQPVEEIIGEWAGPIELPLEPFNPETFSEKSRLMTL